MLVPANKLLLVITCLFISFGGYAQLDALQSVQQSRFMAKKYMKQDSYDSAFLSMNEFIDNTALVDPFDYLNYALCNYKRKDTANFLRYFDKAIAGGVDSIYFSGYLKKLTDTDNIYVNDYINLYYEQTRRAGRAKYDTNLINEVNSMLRLDQCLRDELVHIVETKGKADANYYNISFLARQADSINYQRIIKLFEAGKFPGYHNCGAFASIDIILIHLGDYQEEQWEYIFKRLKAEVLSGNVSPDEVANIADNHYQRGIEKLCSHYGHWTGRTKDLCNCDKVDRERAEIGLEPLKEEYELWKQNLPDCYKGGGK